MVGRNVYRITVPICIQQLGRVEEIIWLTYDVGLSAAAETLVRMRNPQESDCQSRRPPAVFEISKCEAFFAQFFDSKYII